MSIKCWRITDQLVITAQITKFSHTCKTITLWKNGFEKLSSNTFVCFK